MAVHIHAKQIEGAVIEVEVAARAVVGFARIEEVLIAVGQRADETLLRFAVQVKRSEIQKRVVPRAGRSGCLDRSGGFRCPAPG